MSLQSELLVTVKCYKSLGMPWPCMCSTGCSRAKLCEAFNFIFEAGKKAGVESCQDEIQKYQQRINNYIINRHSKQEEPGAAEQSESAPSEEIYCPNCGEIVKHKGEHWNECYTPSDHDGWKCKSKEDNHHQS